MPFSAAARSKALSRPCIPLWYWKRQWATIDPHVEPVEISPNGKDEVIIKVHQVVRGPKGNGLADRLVIHVFQARNGLIERFDIRDVS